MKRAKIMLVAIAVLATVGGALAFKAQKFGNVKYCYTTTDSRPEAKDCTVEFTGTFTTTAVGEAVLYYTTTDNQANCGALECPLKGRTTVEQ
jgi:hypothetical protein